jgi:DNA relaxase NicK
VAVNAPGCTTGALLTTGVHWIRQTRVGADAEAVAARLGERFAWDLERWAGGRYYYGQTIAVGPLRVYHHPDRPEMGVCIDVPGEACEQIGTDGVAWVLAEPEWTCTRIDVAIDGAPFTPVEVREAWRGGDVRTAARFPKDARADRLWRTSEWKENHTGDVFSMGARTSGQYVRCYDRRGFTRIEVEIKGDAAPAAAAVLGACLADRDELAFSEAAIGLLRRFVDFVDAGADSNISRAPMLEWWADFVGDTARMRLWLGERVVGSAIEMLEWALHQTAPVLAVLTQVFGPTVLHDLAKDGRSRWRRRHLEAVALAI